MDFQQQFQKGLEELKAIQADLQKKIEQRQTLDAQLNENKTVKEELDLVKEDTRIFKLIGPALVRQDNVEAKHTVAKRIEYISGELKRFEEIIKTLESNKEKAQENIAKLKSEVEARQQVQAK